MNKSYSNSARIAEKKFVQLVY